MKTTDAPRSLSRLASTRHRITWPLPMRLEESARIATSTPTHLTMNSGTSGSQRRDCSSLRSLMAVPISGKTSSYTASRWSTSFSSWA